MILLLDNYDSFVHTLARYVRELGAEPVVRRNDAVSLDDIAALAPAAIIISPGPCTPRESGISVDVVRRFGASTPILGVCLGHQCIAQAYGGTITRAARPVHGMVSDVYHGSRGLLAGLPSPFRAARYHSLVVERESLPRELHVTATTAAGEVMAIEHETHPVAGVQFHPESAGSEYGYAILDAFLRRGAAGHGHVASSVGGSAPGILAIGADQGSLSELSRERFPVAPDQGSLQYSRERFLVVRDQGSLPELSEESFPAAPDQGTPSEPSHERLSVPADRASLPELSRERLPVVPEPRG